MNIVCERIGELIKELKITQSKMARDLETPRNTVHRWVKGEVIPSTYNLERICELYDVSMDYLTGKRKTRRSRKEEILLNKMLQEIDSNKEKIHEIQFQVELISRFEKEFEIELYKYDPEKLEELEKEIKNYIRKKINKFIRDNTSC